MQHHRFKYFSKLRYAEEFLDGKVFCQTAAYFRDYEDAQARQIIGDEYEGTRLYRPLSGLEINNLTRNRSLTLNAGLECLTKSWEIYVLCMSYACTDVLKEEFKAVAYAEITDPRESSAGGVMHYRKKPDKRESTLLVKLVTTNRKTCRAMCGPCLI
jgi:hypothetical protein